MTIKMNTVNDIIQEINNFTKGKNYDYIFRGERMFYDKISSTYYRFFSEQLGKDLLEENPYRIHEAMKEVIEKAQKETGNQDMHFIQVMIEMQHYNGKSNLIDFTTNILISIFFACHSDDERNIEDEDGFIFIFKRNDFTEIGDFDKEPYCYDIIVKPNQNYKENIRALLQDSIFVSPSLGYIDKNKYNFKIIKIDKQNKKTLLNEIRDLGISREKIFGDNPKKNIFYPFVSNEDNFKTSIIYAKNADDKNMQGDYFGSIEEANK